MSEEVGSCQVAGVSEEDLASGRVFKLYESSHDARHQPVREMLERCLATLNDPEAYAPTHAVLVLRWKDVGDDTDSVRVWAAGVNVLETYGLLHRGLIQTERESRVDE